MPRIKNWDKRTDESKMIEYYNTETGARAFLFQPADADGDWIASIIESNYPVVRSSFETKKAARSWLCDQLREHPEPEFECPKCGSSLRASSKDAGVKDKVFAECSCGRSVRSRYTYPYEKT